MTKARILDAGGRTSGLAGALASAVLVSACGGATGSGPSAPSAEGDASGSIRLILHDPTGRDAPKGTCNVELCTSLRDLVEKAEHTIDFAIYGMRGQPALVDALHAAKARGVRVRGVVDRDLDGQSYYSGTDELVAALGDVGSDHEADVKLAARHGPRDPSKPACERPAGFEGPVQCLAYDLGDRCVVAAHASRERLDDEGSIMHDKMFVVDERWVWTGSTNLSDSGTGGYNANLVAVVDSPRVARWYTDEIEQMVDEGRYHGLKQSRPAMITRVGDAEVEVLFSPQDRPITRRVRRLLRDASERIDVAVFFLTHKGIAADLIAAHRRGVRVRVILDATAAKNGYTKHELLRMAGIPVKIESWGGKMHMKSAAIDGQTVIAGSMNWTSAGEHGNDENTLVLRSAKLAEQYHDFFDRIWTALGDEWLHGRPDPESRDSGSACTDGRDNDFDDLVDADDPGCGDVPPLLPALPPWRVVPKREGVCNVDDPEPLETSASAGSSRE